MWPKRSKPAFSGMFLSGNWVSHFIIIFISCFRRVTLLPKSNVHTVVIGMEVLDNLPHDKVRAASRKKLEQAEVRSTAGGDEEVFVPLTDPLLAKVTKAVPSYVNIYPSWVPSVACGVLHHIVNQRPNNLGLVFADFDWLPAPDLNLDASLKDDRLSAWSEGEPIVTDMEGVRMNACCIIVEIWSKCPQSLSHLL